MWPHSPPSSVASKTRARAGWECRWLWVMVGWGLPCLPTPLIARDLEAVGVAPHLDWVSLLPPFNLGPQGVGGQTTLQRDREHLAQGSNSPASVRNYLLPNPCLGPLDKGQQGTGSEGHTHRSPCLPRRPLWPERTVASMSRCWCEPHSWEQESTGNSGGATEPCALLGHRGFTFPLRQSSYPGGCCPRGHCLGTL